MADGATAGATAGVGDGARRGLVLGGGGVTGIAWELGVLAALRAEGLDLTGADTVVGTSAGSVVGAQVTSAVDLDQWYEEQLAPPDHEIGAAFPLRTALSLGVRMVLPGDGRVRRQRIGRAARRAHPGDGSERIAVIEARLRGPDGAPLAWPDRDLRITAVDADSGSFTVFDRESGVDLLHAVAASCAVPLVWPPVAINGRSYVDGGMRSAANADLPTGCEVVVRVAPLLRSVSRHHRVPAQLERTGARHRLVIAPDRQALEAIGRNVLDPTRRAPAARAGWAQGRRLARRVAEHWPR